MGIRYCSLLDVDVWTLEVTYLQSLTSSLSLSPLSAKFASQLPILYAPVCLTSAAKLKAPSFYMIYKPHNACTAHSSM